MPVERASQVVGRVPPQSIEAEQSTLGSMMIEKSALLVGLKSLNARDFYRPTHGEIFDCLAALADRDEPCDLITLQEELRQRGKLEDCGGTAYLMALIDAVPTAANLEHYARIVADKADLRRFVAAGTEIVAMGYDGDEDPAAMRGRILDRVLQLVADGRSSRARPVSEVVNAVWAMAERASKGEKPPSVPYKLHKLNELSGGGLHAGDFVMFAADTSQGKTVAETECVEQACLAGEPVLLFSLEMIAEEMALRMLSARSSVDAIDVRAGRANFEKLQKACGDLYNWRLELVDSSVTLSELEYEARRWAIENRKDQLGLIVIDYAQLVMPSERYESENAAQTAVLAGLKRLARDLRVPLVSASQFRKPPPQARVVSKDIPKSIEQVRWPSIDDLFGSRQASASPDGVIIIVNPESSLDCYGKRPCYFSVAKYRNGRTGMFKAWFTPKYVRFDDVETRFGDPGLPLETEDKPK
jgi:replicative DNA helicase